MTLSSTSGLGPLHKARFNFAEFKGLQLQVVSICSDWLWGLRKKPFHPAEPFAASCGFAGLLLRDGHVPEGMSHHRNAVKTWWNLSCGSWGGISPLQCAHPAL